MKGELLVEIIQIGEDIHHVCELAAKFPASSARLHRDRL
jgi:hypothetical protein